jgi:EAL domain-containing protein (putative c-di-GMP-specific phosphodiesterase class I)
MDDPLRATDVLSRLHGRGIRLSIDDFGTGYSSLAYLKRLPVDQIKIDKSFVMDMASDDNDRSIVKATIGLGHELGLETVAEGVEERAIWDMLKGMHCDSVQGYLLSQPLPAEQCTKWLSSWRLKAAS